jgi:hypothetical protein
MSPQDPQAAMLLAHVVSQIEQNVNFLAAQNYLSQSDAATILTKLPNVANTPAMNKLANEFSNVAVSTARAVPPPPRSNPAFPEPQESSLPRARAIWAYNGDADDLQFDAGDVIEIVEELNADWYKGRLDGREGLLPASYVEKIVSTGRSSKPYKPFGAAYHGLSAPPPAGQGPNEVGLEEKPGQEEKKSKFAAYKGTLAHSAVGGVGFGAGSAIGGGLVRAIF